MEHLRQMLLARRSKVKLERGVSSGTTLLNLACTDRPDVCFLPGGYYYYVGDSTSGKTWLSLGCLAEASINSQFDKYRLIYDDVEGGALMDIERFFGKRLANRLEAPAMSEKGNPRFSSTVESFYYHIDSALKAKKPFIYVLDSQDALNSEAAKDKFQEQKKAASEGKDAPGSYGDGKAKYHSEHLRQVLAGLRRTGSILIIIGQTRDNLGFGFEKKVRSGGKALRFYANIEIWTSVVGKIKKTVNGHKRTVGVEVQAEVRKNRVTGKTGKDRAVVFPIFYGLGIDDIGACVDYLIEEQHWPKCKEGFEANELLMKGSRDQIIKAVEEDGMESKLRETAGAVWIAIEVACNETGRKPRYG